MKFLAFVFLTAALFLEISITTIPLVLLVLLCLMVLMRDPMVFLLALILGLLIDLLTFKTLGASSIFFVTFLFFVMLYERKFEITTYYFVASASFLGSLAYLFYLGFNNLIIIQAIIGSVIGSGIFYIFNKLKMVDSESSER